MRVIASPAPWQDAAWPLRSWPAVNRILFPPSSPAPIYAAVWPPLSSPTSTGIRPRQATGDGGREWVVRRVCTSSGMLATCQKLMHLLHRSGRRGCQAGSISILDRGQVGRLRASSQTTCMGVGFFHLAHVHGEKKRSRDPRGWEGKCVVHLSASLSVCMSVCLAGALPEVEKASMGSGDKR